MLFIYLVGCYGSYLHQDGYFLVVHKLSSCGTWALFLYNMWDLSSLTRNRTCVPGIVRQILKHWTTRVVPIMDVRCVLICQARRRMPCPGSVLNKWNFRIWQRWVGMHLHYMLTVWPGANDWSTLSLICKIRLTWASAFYRRCED